jgi:hypothetical protein
MRILASSLAALALIALGGAPLRAQLIDSAVAGRWTGRAELTVPWTVARSLAVQLDIQPDGSVSGALGDALLVDARIYADSRVARALGLGRSLAIEGRLAGAIIRAEDVRRERFYLTLDRVLERMVGELQTSGLFDGPVSGRVITARVGLARVGAVVAGSVSAPPRAAVNAANPLSP